MIRFWATIKTLHQKKKKKKQKISLFCQKKEKIKSKGSFFKEKYGSGEWNTISLKSHNSTSTCRSEKRFSAFYSPSNSLSDDISLTLKLKKIHFIHFGVVDPCDVMIWHFVSNKTLRLPGQHAIKVNLPSLVKKCERYVNLHTPYPPQGVIGNSKGEGRSWRPRFLSKSMKLNWNFQRQFPGHSNQKTIHGGQHGFFLEWYIANILICLVPQTVKLSPQKAVAVTYILMVRSTVQPQIFG